MAGAAVLASGAIGALFSTCVGGVEGGKGAPIAEQQAKRKRSSSLKGGDRTQRASPPPLPPPPPPAKGEWWSGSSDEMEREVGVGKSAASGNMNMQGTPSLPASGSSTPARQDLSGPHAATSDQFVNHALIMWNEKRRLWTGTRPRGRVQRRGPCIREGATYEDLLATSRPFPQPVPLPEMVEFLVDQWDQEGLYD